MNDSTRAPALAEVQDLRFPTDGRLDQDEEWCLVRFDNGERRRIRFHDYNEIYSIPGLYETLFYEKLRCKSPSTVAALLEVEAAHAGPPMKDLVTLDVGAGNGMVAEELRGRGVETLVGVDIIPEAAEAAHRDRPNLYEAYHVIDLIDPPAEIDRSLSRRGFNCLVTVAALGFGDIPPAAFARAYNYVADRGLIAFNIRDKFLSGEDDSGFSRLIRRSIESKILDIAQQNRYCHRYSTRGERLHYIAMVGRKRADIPKEWFDDMQ